MKDLNLWTKVWLEFLRTKSPPQCPFCEKRELSVDIVKYDDSGSGAVFFACKACNKGFHNRVRNESILSAICAE